MNKTLQKILYSGAVVGALSFGGVVGNGQPNAELKNSPKQETSVVSKPKFSDLIAKAERELKKQASEPRISINSNGYSICLKSPKIGEIYFRHAKDNKNNEDEELSLGLYGSRLGVTLEDWGCNGIVDRILDSSGTCYFSFDGERMKERFEKANKVFAKYKLKLSDLIAKTEKNWKKEHSQDPLDYYLKRK